MNAKECDCHCGYACNRKCGLPILECMEQHYKRDCGHVWDGPWAERDWGGSVTCSRCGMLAIQHDMRVGL